MNAASPTWGRWITHYDSIVQAPTMVANFNDTNTVVSLLFDTAMLNIM